MSRLVFLPERGQRVPVRLWAREIAEDTLRQLLAIARQPYVVGHVASMPDAHVASGVAVGTVFATEHTVVPSALGSDLGCGMSAVRLARGARSLDRATLERLVAALGRAIPAGAALHRGKGVTVPEALLLPTLSTHSLTHARDALAPRHLGTLGGGNHFLELDRDAEGALWLLVHSGSRGLGGAIAKHHTHAARAAGGDALAGIDTREPAGAAYLADVAWALAFARANRERIARRALEVIADEVGEGPEHEAFVDVHHNFVARERWLGQELLVHRKGAVSVPLGARALVPGSMGTASYLVEGLGSEASFGSCAHGAGRRLTRTEARKTIPVRELRHAMRRVVFPEHLARDLVEEAPDAYRDIGDVMAEQEDLVRPLLRLEPIAVLKG